MAACCWRNSPAPPGSVQDGVGLDRLFPGCPRLAGIRLIEGDGDVAARDDLVNVDSRRVRGEGGR